jgi:hypothetical protein
MKREHVEAHGEICKTDPCTACRIGVHLAKIIFEKRRGARVEIHVSQTELETMLTTAALAALEIAS